MSKKNKNKNTNQTSVRDKIRKFNFLYEMTGVQQGELRGVIERNNYDLKKCLSEISKLHPLLPFDHDVKRLAEYADFYKELTGKDLHIPPKGTRRSDFKINIGKLYVLMVDSRPICHSKNATLLSVKAQKYNTKKNKVEIALVKEA